MGTHANLCCYLPKSARAYPSPQSDRSLCFCSGPISVDPICPQPNDVGRDRALLGRSNSAPALLCQLSDVDASKQDFMALHWGARRPRRYFLFKPMTSREVAQKLKLGAGFYEHLAIYIFYRSLSLYTCIVFVYIQNHIYICIYIYMYICYVYTYIRTYVYIYMYT